MAGGRRHNLYQRCDCGCIQSSGKLVQSRLWYETQWLDGSKPETTPAAVLSYRDYQTELAKSLGRNSQSITGQIDRESQTDQGLQPDPDTGQQTDIRPDPEPKQTGKTGLYWLAGGVALLAAMVGRV